MAFYISNNILDKYKCTGSGTCYALRTNCEKTNIKRPDGNNDISNTCKQDSTEATCHSFLNHISKYESVVTNRLHVAIAGPLLGKKVDLYENNY